MAPHAAESESVVPPMPERTPKALRDAIAEHTPELLPDFDAHWKRAIADAYNLGPVPAFMALWWGEYALARDPELDAHVRDLEHRTSAPTSPRPRLSSKRRRSFITGSENWSPASD